MNATTIIACPSCGTKNRIPLENPGLEAKCGRCHRALHADATSGGQETLTLRCGECRAKNRVPLSKLHAGAKCGRCSEPLEHQNLLDGRLVMVSDANFAQAVLKSPLPVLLYGWASWCSVCSGIDSQVDQLAAETKGKIRVAKLNIDANPQLASQYSILSVPTFFIFDAGQLRERLPGAVPKHDLMLKMAHYL